MIWSALVLGIVSSVHCAAMCGPLQGVLLGVFIKKKQFAKTIIYHAGRLSSYILLGMIAQVFGKALGLQSWQQQASLLSGLFLLGAIVLFYILKLDRQLMSLLFPLLNRAQNWLRKNKKWGIGYLFGSGLLNGFLPCGMVYFALFAAIGTSSTSQSSLYMLSFGLGTLPLLLVANYGLLSLMGSKSGWLQKITPWLITGVAILLILRGMNLGIPYLSPQQIAPGASTLVCP